MIRSLRLRLLVAAVLAVAFALLLVGFGLSRVFSSYVADRYRADMSAIIDQLAASLEVGKNGFSLSAEPSDPRFDLPGSGLYWQVRPASGEVLQSRSLWDIELPAGDIPPGPYGFCEAVGPDGDAVLVEEREVVLETSSGPLTFTILAGFDRKMIDQALADYHGSLWAMLVLTACVLICAAVLQVAVGLAPLWRLQSAVARVRSGLADQVTGEGPSELMPLVGELNHLLKDRETAIARARARASDLAHGLKTPLTVLSQLADNFSDRDRLLVRQQVELIRQRADRQLQSARLGVEQMTQTDLALLTGKLVSVLQPVTVPRGIAWSVSIDEGLMVEMDPADLAEALGNVLDNATRFANSLIAIKATRQAETGDTVRLDIDDDGPGVDEAALAGIVTRGVHLEEGEGTGLGLAITAEILAAYGGQIAILRAPIGGLRISLTLPART
ncbi:sensor histidine kinase [Rhizobium sp. G187]|uniref:sensor histidine kinase n=1 Tax=Rhizobium sp. G187 TaxID=3451352 RepID=UPI003EE5B437